MNNTVRALATAPVVSTTWVVFTRPVVAGARQYTDDERSLHGPRQRTQVSVGYRTMYSVIARLPSL